MEFDINDFINTENPDESICREERQYAALLYFVFLRVMNNIGTDEENSIVNSILKEYTKIHHVYFEASLMRDYFSDIKKSRLSSIQFNKLLLTFCDVDISDKDIISDSLGSPSQKWRKIEQNYIKDENSRRNFLIARYMMRAKPDLMVIYENNNMKYSKIIECKYTQKEGMYKDIYGKRTIPQKYIQKRIQDFLFYMLTVKYFEKEKTEIIKTSGVTEVDFENKNNPDPDSVFIDKTQLIELAYKK